MPDDTTDTTNASNTLTEFVRNRYFSGKLMKASDKYVEQNYHAGQERLNNRLLTGNGVVCGLDVTLETDGDTLTVTLQPGVAIDDCGNLVIVESETPRTLDHPDGDDIYLYIELKECHEDPVPDVRNQNACETKCKPNRIRETFDVSYREASGTDAAPPVQSLPEIDFPTVQEVDAENPEDLDRFRMIDSYFDRRQQTCRAPGDGAVFLGRFDQDADGWTRRDDRTRKVPTHDGLHAITARHATDFGNPHDTTLLVTERAERDENDAPLPGADLATAADDTETPAVTLLSSDGSVTIAPDESAETIDFTADVPEPSTEAIDEYLRRRSLWCACRFLSLDRRLRLSRRHGISTAREIARSLDNAVDNDVAGDPSDFLEAFRGEGILALEAQLLEDLLGLEGLAELDRYERAVQALDNHVPEAEPEDPVATARNVASAHERVCTTVPCLHLPEPERELDCVDFDVEPAQFDDEFEHRGLNFGPLDEQDDFSAAFTEAEDVPALQFVDSGIRVSLPSFEYFDATVLVTPRESEASRRIELAVLDENERRVVQDWTPESSEVGREYTLRIDSKYDEYDTVVFTGGGDAGHITEICYDER